MSKHKGRKEDVVIEEVQPVTPEPTLESVQTPVLEPSKLPEVATGWVSKDFESRKDVAWFLNELASRGYSVRIDYLHKSTNGSYSGVLFVKKADA